MVTTRTPNAKNQARALLEAEGLEQQAAALREQCLGARAALPAVAEVVEEYFKLRGVDGDAATTISGAP